MFCSPLHCSCESKGCFLYFNAQSDDTFEVIIMESTEGVCILVHIVSHSDLFVSYVPPPTNLYGKPPQLKVPCFARPRFSNFNPICQDALAVVRSATEFAVITHTTDDNRQVDIGFRFGKLLRMAI